MNNLSENSPIIKRGEELYAIDEEGREYGPLCKADCKDGIYIVFGPSQGAMLSSTGRLISDIVYDHAYNENGYTVLEKDGKFGFYSHRDKSLMPCIYDDLETPEEPHDPIIVNKEGVEGLVSTDGIFHPLDEDPDAAVVYL